MQLRKVCRSLILVIVLLFSFALSASAADIVCAEVAYLGLSVKQPSYVAGESVEGQIFFSNDYNPDGPPDPHEHPDPSLPARRLRPGLRLPAEPG